MDELKKIADVAATEQKDDHQQYDLADRRSQIYANEEMASFELAQLQESLKSKIQDRYFRGGFAVLIFVLLVHWLLAVLFIICLTGAKIFIISDTIIITLIGTTTAQVAAFFLAVTKYLFPKSP